MNKTTIPLRSLSFRLLTFNLLKPGLVLLSLFLCTAEVAAINDISMAQANYVMTAEVKYENAWWTDRSAGMIGGISGSVVGLVGALIGIFAGIGKCRRFVLSLMILMIVLGVICLVFGFVALFLKQPYAVYYPLLLFGFIDTLLPACLYPVARRGYEAIELRKMTAQDVP